MQDKFDWSDVPVLLAFARTGTIADAGATLGIDETTASRRLKRLEAALGTPLVTKTAGKLSLTTVGRLAVDRAIAMEVAANSLLLDDAVRQDDISHDVSGTVRITGLGYILNHIVIPILPSLVALHPLLRVQLQSDNRNLDVAAGETDVAVRMAAPNDARQRADKVGYMSVTAYRPRTQFHGVPMRRCAWIGPDEEYATIPEGRWLNANIPSERVVLRTNYTLSNAVAVRSGIGCALLPVIIGDNDRDMVRMQPDVILRREMWLLYREGTTDSSAIGVTVSRLKRAFKDLAPQMDV